MVDMMDWTDDVLDSLDVLGTLEQLWRELGERACARPFQRFGWHAAWLSTLAVASGCRPHLALLRRGERLLGVLPLARRFHRGLRLLEWSGHGMTDYNDALLDPEIDKEAALAALWRAALAYGADIARLTHVPPGAACDAFLAARSVRTVAGETSWAVSLAGVDSDAWLASLSPGSRRNFHRYTRKLEEAGVGFWVWSPTEPIAPFLEALVAQKRA
jgi:CelD/BcsL family acetyltransferase involved in cellulose biosynthesis